jgi:hypothetical protein
LERDGVRKQVVVDAGTIVNASSNLPREFLGQFLINLGHITEEQFERAYATQQETKVFLGRILVMIGLVNEATLQGVLAMKFRETVLEAFNWVDGTFSFTTSTKKPEQPEGLAVRVSLLEVHKEGDFRVQAWEQIRSAFPTGDATLTLERDQLMEPPRPGSIDEKIFNYIEQGQTIDEMALRLHATDFFLYNRLYAFYRLKALTVNAPRAAQPDLEVNLGLRDSPTAEQILSNARSFFSQGNLRDAFTLAKRAHQMTATIDATQLIKQVESAWLPLLKAEFLVNARVPALTVAPDQLTKLPLSAPERYLLSRVDGRRDVGAIIRVAPLKEFEALAFFDRFTEQRWVHMS